MSQIGMSQSELHNELPMYEMSQYKEHYNPGNVISRMVEGLGYRYYWATEELTPEDLAFKPSEDARDAFSTIEHLYGLSTTILNTAKNKANIRPSNFSGWSFDQLRASTLSNLEEASQLFQDKSAEEISELKIIFESNGNKSEYPFWNLINGPIADAIYHTGQIVSFRRSSGNPMDPNVNVFIGKNKE